MAARIDASTSLPPPGTRESPTLEFKGALNRIRGSGKIDDFELAKDIAAMASVSGGTILVGAFEDRKSGTLGTYKPLTETEANETITAYEHAVRDRCSPHPIIDGARIPCAAGFVVAINVMPFPTQPIGVSVSGDKEDGWGGHAYVFFARLSTHAIPLAPDQLPMFMLPRVRRIAFLLGAIPQGRHVEVREFNRNPGGVERKDVIFQSVDQMANAVHFTSETSSSRMVYPLDQVQTVYQDGSDRWHVAVRQYR